MRCNDFDAHIDEMLSGILHPDANEHMRQCERCTSHYHARAVLQDGLRKLASVSASGPSRSTDRAVMESYRRFQQRRGEYAAEAAAAGAGAGARMFSFPSRGLAAAWTTRTWWSGAAAAALVFAVLGSAVHLWHGVPPVNAPVIANAPATPVNEQSASMNPRTSGAAISGGRTSNAIKTAASAALRIARRPAQLSPAANVPATNASLAAAPEGGAQPMITAKAPAGAAAVFGEGASYDSTPVTQLSAGVAPVVRLASTGAANSVAQSASSTWPGYSNLMYCDPVVCSGPMQVVHIKVPVGQVKPNLGQTVGNSFVNAEVVVGPDGVARAIRVAN
jgi:hypothetical protein